MSKNTAKKQLPNLNRKLENLLQKSLAAAGSRYGVYGYLASVLKTYRKWKREGVLQTRMKQVRNLRCTSAREESNPFIQILAATSGHYRSLIEAWEKVNLRRSTSEAGGENG